MMSERIQGLLDELTAESMRTATLVGIASIPAGYLWIHLFGTQSAAVLLFTGIVVGLFYSDRPTPAGKAGARAGLFAPIPELTFQLGTGVSGIWASGANVELKVVMTVFAAPLVFLVAWVLFASVVILLAVVTALGVQQVRPRVSNADGTR